MSLRSKAKLICEGWLVATKAKNLLAEATMPAAFLLDPEVVLMACQVHQADFKIVVRPLRRNVL